MLSANSFELPERDNTNSVPATVTTDEQLQLLMSLVEQVMTFENVSVKSVPFELENGQIVCIPGPFAYLSPKASSVPHEVDDEDAEDDEDCGDNGQKFVARNEFGHIRLQNFLSVHQNKPHHAADLIGGHCVLPPAAFKMCVAKGWGTPHPFGGHFHPIVGTVIPETTLVFKAPRTPQEAVVLYEILHVSYRWAAGHIE